ncbi:hypothetical protein DUNSADRAFT_12518 [Dunaliella salina]|uniref:WW domain-containing protein n=1 Tax=Dunaliella salina TaxID=3046 RepID=A0ABQ7GB99_DUNSA|nr:hypothetical protein DUNSADRAFT_12518 [Dunaliella salina]|eukprot:KAF5831863.1 hypothetical protein DUNSADRAFT_12518 [Dunaliella salina]
MSTEQPQEQPQQEQPQQEQPQQEQPPQEQPQQEQPPQEQPQQEQTPQEQPPQQEQQPPQEQEQEQQPPPEQPAKEEQQPPQQEQQPPQQEQPAAETNNTEQQHPPKQQQEQPPAETNNTEQQQQQQQPPQQEQPPSETNNTEQQQEQKPPQQEQPVNMAEQQQNFAAAAAQAAQLAAKFGAESGKRKFDGEEGPDSKRQNTEGLQGTTTTGLDGQVTFTLMCAPDKVGRIIGKAGVTIKELEARTGVRVQVDHKAGTDLKPVHLIGSGTAVEQCKALVHEVLTSETGSLSSAGGETVRKVPCPPGIVGRIIGRGGETIRSLQSGSGAHIMVDQNFPPDQNREITISGRADCVDRATRMVNDLVSGDPASAQQVIQKYGVGTTRTIDCPKSVVGRVIGKGGETIKGLQKQFSTSVQIDQTVNPCKITVAGPTQNVMNCQAAIEDVMEDRPAMGMGMGMGMPGGRPPFNPAMFGAPGPYGAAPYGAPYGATPYGAPAPAYGGFPGAAAYPPAPAAANPYAAAMPQPNPYVPPAYSQPAAAYPGYGGAAPDPYAAAAAAAQFGAAAAAPAAAAAAPAMPSVWQALQDDQGRTYYYNSQTGVSQWEKPAEMP